MALLGNTSKSRWLEFAVDGDECFYKLEDKLRKLLQSKVLQGTLLLFVTLDSKIRSKSSGMGKSKITRESLKTRLEFAHLRLVI